jgi:hypothetical protein
MPDKTESEPIRLKSKFKTRGKLRYREADTDRRSFSDEPPLTVVTNAKHLSGKSPIFVHDRHGQEIEPALAMTIGRRLHDRYGLTIDSFGSDEGSDKSSSYIYAILIVHVDHRVVPE